MYDWWTYYHITLETIQNNFFLFFEQTILKNFNPKCWLSDGVLNIVYIIVWFLLKDGLVVTKYLLVNTILHSYIYIITVAQYMKKHVFSSLGETSMKPNSIIIGKDPIIHTSSLRIKKNYGFLYKQTYIDFDLVKNIRFILKILQ